VSAPVERHLTPIDLDELGMDLLTAEERSAVQAHADACAACSRLRAEHEAHVGKFRREVFSHTVADVKRRVARRTGRTRVSALVAGVAMTAAIASVTISMRDRRPVEGRIELATKGPGTLQVYARRDQQVFQVNDGAVLTAGDTVRFFVEPGTEGHVIIGSIDGRGMATIYFPYGGVSSAPVAPGQRFAVPGGILLDRAPGPERIFAVFSREPLRAERVKQALSQLGSRGAEAIRQTHELALPGTSQASLGFEKSEPAP
jgi:hypothetical protein